MARAIKEARYNNSTLNKNIGKYNLPHSGTKFCFPCQNLKTNK